MHSSTRFDSRELLPAHSGRDWTAPSTTGPPEDRDPPPPRAESDTVRQERVVAGSDWPW